MPSFVAVSIHRFVMIKHRFIRDNSKQVVRRKTSQAALEEIPDNHKQVDCKWHKTSDSVPCFS